MKGPLQVNVPIFVLKKCVYACLMLAGGYANTLNTIQVGRVINGASLYINEHPTCSITDIRGSLNGTGKTGEKFHGSHLHTRML